MKKYICDRCKKEEEQVNLGIIETTPPGAICYINDPIELCGKCYKEFLKFMAEFTRKEA